MGWTNIIKTMGTNTVFLAVLGYVAKSIFSQLTSRDMGKFKIEIQSTNDKGLENFRSEMQKLAFEHQFRFSKLHEKRAEVMAELYRLLVITEKDCCDSLSMSSCPMKINNILSNYFVPQSRVQIN